MNDPRGKQAIDGEMFWLVWCPERGWPSFRHAHEHSARAEAARLASATPGARFYVLCAERCVTAQDVELPYIPF